MSVAVPTDVNKLSFSARFAWDLAARTSFSLSWSCTGPAPRNLLCRRIADLPFLAVGRESAESPKVVALESPRSYQASAWAGQPMMLELANRPRSVLHGRVTNNPRTGTSGAIRNDRRNISQIILMALLIPQLCPHGRGTAGLSFHYF